MKQKKFVGLDVHTETIAIVVIDEPGNILVQSIIATDAQVICDFLSSLSGEIHLAFEVGTQSNWLYQQVNPLVEQTTVCNPRHNKLLQFGAKADLADAGKLAELLRLGSLKEVWQHSAQQMQLKELVHSYESLMADSTRVKNRLKAIFRSQAIRYSGTEVYQVEKRADWLAKLTAPGLNFRAQTLFSELDTIGELGCQTRQKMLRQAGQHEDFQRLREIPGLGPINVSRLLAQVGTPFRFPNKRAFWKYCGFAVKTFSSADHRVLNGHIQKRRRAPQTRGLNQDFCRRLKDVFKTAAQKTAYREPFCQYYENLLKQGTKPSLAQVSLARKIAATTLSIWKNQTRFEKCRVAATS